MIITKIHSGLGNQLFQYATGRRLAAYRKTELKLDICDFPYYKIRQYGLLHFNISATIATPSEIDAMRYHRWLGLEKIYRRFTGERPINERNHVREPFFQFYPEVMNAKNNSYVWGFWQSERYFKDIEGILKKELTVAHPITERGRYYANLIQNSESVCVHVRRGDYLTDSFFDVCPVEYYQNAFQKLLYLVPDAQIFVFSDDLAWVKQHIQFPSPTILVAGNPDYEDFRLMSMCRYFIIANSTFSWWSAWLSDYSNKIVYAPKKWFADDIDKDTSDLIPTSWVQV